LLFRLTPGAAALGGIAIFAFSACGSAGNIAAHSETGKPPKDSMAQSAPAATAPKPTPLTDNDRLALDQARAACASRNFEGLFEAMAASQVVRQKYSAPTIEVSVLDGKGNILSTRQVARESYREFPVVQFDYYWKPAHPKISGDEDEYVDLQFNESQSEIFSVEWARVHYDGKSDGGDDLGNIIGADGKPLPPGAHPNADGQLLFEPTKDCWRLQSDTRWRR